MTTVLEPEMQTQGAMPPPAPPVRLAVATDDPEKPLCVDCNHRRMDHVAGVRCLGKASFGADCSCKFYRAPQQ